jgi:tetratricopeptide (TPR) repeat protein
MPEDAQSSYEAGLILFRDRSFEQAISRFREALGRDPAPPGTHHYLARSLLGKGLTDAAIGEFCEALRQNPGDGNSRYWLAVTLLGKNQVQDALPLLYEAARLEPGSFHQFSREILERLEKTCPFPRVEEFFKKCLEIVQGQETAGNAWKDISLSCAHLHGALGQIYFRKGLLNGAMLQYREAIRCWPEDPSFHAELADIYFIANLNEEAVAEYQASLSHSSGDAAVHKKLGDALVKTRQFIDAFNEYREAVRIEPQNEYYTRVYTQFRKLFIDGSDGGKTNGPALPGHIPSRGTGPLVQNDAFRKILQAGESEFVEYKSSALWSKTLSKGDISSSDSKDLHKFGRDTSKVIIAKTIAGFLNTGGGNLVIGIKENKEGQPDEIIGIEHEYPKLKDPCPDGYRRMLVDEIIRKYLPAEIFHHMSRYIRIQFPKSGEKTLCWLEIGKADEGVFLSVQDEEIFVIRVDAETRQIADKALVDYCRRQFG